MKQQPHQLNKLIRSLLLVCLLLPAARGLAATDGPSQPTGDTIATPETATPDSVAETASPTDLQTIAINFQTLSADYKFLTGDYTSLGLETTEVGPIPLYFGWHTIAAAAGLTFGLSPLFSDAADQFRIDVRDHLQDWRTTTFDGRAFHFDDYTQFVPMVSVIGLNLAGVESTHERWSLIRRSASSYLLVSMVVYPIKLGLDVQRPDNTSWNSFPSGHTAWSFAGAELLRLEYGRTSVWIPITGYSIAALTGYMRMYNNRHWITDVLGGAAIGILCVDLAYWLNDLVFKD